MSTLRPRLWHMNADFEAELAALPGSYRRTPTIARRNRRLAPALLWLAREGDALLIDEPWSDEERREAKRRAVELLEPARAARQGGRAFTPWGWTPSAVEAGARAGAIVEPVPHDVVVRVNSKLFSHAMERELGVALPDAALAPSLEELNAAVARACPSATDKWVVKAPLGFAARGRVLGRGPALDLASAVWAARRFARGETLLFEPWLEVRREYGVQLRVEPHGAVTLLGISRMLTTGAGATTGFVLGEAVAPERAAELDRVAREVGRRLRDAGYSGPANVDALEHAGGLRPLLEINARHTMGLVALAVERELGSGRVVEWAPPTCFTRA
jgi:hypothetical protein